MNRRVLTPAGLLLAIGLVSIATPLFSLPDPTEMNIVTRFAPPSFEHLLGTDKYGRDLFVRLLHGARISLTVALVSASLAALIGVTLGLLGGYFRGVTEFLALRSADIVLCFPPLLMALLIVTIFGPGLGTLVAVLAIVYAPGFARVAYAGTLSTRHNDFVDAVRALGASDFRIMWRTILPNIGGPVLVQFSLTVAAAITLESGLSFLGLGIVPPTPSWGLMIAEARSTMAQAPLLLFWPCLALTGTIVLVNVMCDGLRDWLDPRPAARKRRFSVREALLPGMLTSPEHVLQIRNLSISHVDTPDDEPAIVRGLNLNIAPGETVALVGESGSGKSLTSLAAIGLLAEELYARCGSVLINGTEMLDAAPDALRALRGKAVAMIFQDPMSSLNPVYTIGEQLAEAEKAHHPKREASAIRKHSVKLLGEIGISDPESRIDAYPHELSGGMRQRVMIAMALINEPDLIIADEPTTALDVTVQAQVLDLLARMKQSKNPAMLFVSHSLPVVSEIADRIVVLYAGEVVEEGPASEILTAPRHPYTKALIAAVPGRRPFSARGDLDSAGIPGSVPRADDLPEGCVFSPRCTMAARECGEAHPELTEAGFGRFSRCFRWKELA